MKNILFFLVLLFEILNAYVVDGQSKYFKRSEPKITYGIKAGINLSSQASPDNDGVFDVKSLLLFHAAARLRADAFSYISLETALSDAGVISQIPINWISLMSSGRSNTIRCGNWGTIEFVHTAKTPDAVASRLHYDSRCHLWRASVDLALQDMRATRRNMDLIDWSAVNEPV